MSVFTRRDFARLAAAAGVLPLADSAAPQQNQSVWHQRIRRIGQVNFSEKDVVEADVEAWADYWAEVKVEAVQINVTGMIAFYPTEVPYHKRSRYLGNRDFFGECCRAAKARGIRVIGRMSPDLQWEDALEAHPEWFVRDPGPSGAALQPHPRLVSDLHVLHLLHAADPGHHARSERPL
jgi:hypothetical protein